MHTLSLVLYIYNLYHTHTHTLDNKSLSTAIIVYPDVSVQLMHVPVAESSLYTNRIIYIYTGLYDYTYCFAAAIVVDARTHTDGRTRVSSATV